ncbi:hypothetical protein EWM64_g4871 [Hericium alpestre]|uniref:Uncharacterized protein n=1 Tax=Hericium alpestre TaxID=135208 RepID=A0A4Y9ZYW2_9AGAM|nr:hypothetical protein EWM64_g4871 [Hericium alpestre]
MLARVQATARISNFEVTTRAMDAIAAEEAHQRPKKVVPQVVMKPRCGRGGACSGGSTRPAKASSSKTKPVDDEDGEAMDLDHEPNNETEEGARPEDEMDIDGGLPVLKTGKPKGKGKGKGKAEIDEDVVPYKKVARGGRKGRTSQSEEEGWSEDSDDIRDPTYKPERPNADKSNVEMAEEGEDEAFAGERSKGSQKVLQKGDKSSKGRVSNSTGSKRIKRKETIRAMVKQHHAQRNYFASPPPTRTVRAMLTQYPFPQLELHYFRPIIPIIRRFARRSEVPAPAKRRGGLRSTWQDPTQVEDSRAGIEDAPAERGYAGTSFEYLDGFEDGANDWHEGQEEPISAEKPILDIHYSDDDSLNPRQQDIGRSTQSSHCAASAPHDFDSNDPQQQDLGCPPSSSHRAAPVPHEFDSYPRKQDFGLSLPSSGRTAPAPRDLEPYDTLQQRLGPSSSDRVAPGSHDRAPVLHDSSSYDSKAHSAPPSHRAAPVLHNTSLHDSLLQDNESSALPSHRTASMLHENSSTGPSCCDTGPSAPPSHRAAPEQYNIDSDDVPLQDGVPSAPSARHGPSKMQACEEPVTLLMSEQRGLVTLVAGIGKHLQAIELQSSKKSVRINPIVYKEPTVPPQIPGPSRSVKPSTICACNICIHARSASNAPSMAPVTTPSNIFTDDAMPANSEDESDEDNPERKTRQSSYNNSHLPPGALAKWQDYYVHMWREVLGTRTDPWLMRDLLGPAQELWDKVFPHIPHMLEARQEAAFALVHFF